MNGIRGIINRNQDTEVPHVNKRENFIYDVKEFSGVYVERNTKNKFLNDKAFFETDKYIFLIEGVVFNIEDLKHTYHQTNWEHTLVSMYEQKGEAFFNDFRGTFNGFFYDKIEKVTIVFTDHIGDKPIYYYENDSEFIFASEINAILMLLKKNAITYTLDKKGAYSLLTHGYMIEDLTPFNEIKRLKAGSYIKIQEHLFSVSRYHLLTNTPDESMKDQEIIDKMDYLFKQAIYRQTSKNKEYGYIDIAPLSAGLDSRMTTYALAEQSKNILSVTYSQSNYLDETVPKAISSELKTHFLFKTLDNGLSLFYLDEMVQRTVGVVLYGGPAQVWDVFHLLDHSNIGVIHTGMLGDVVVGTFYKSLEKDKEVNIEDGVYSKFLIDRLKYVLKDYKIEDYKNQEIFNFYNRGFNGANMGSPLIFQEFSESYSPFYDIDFLEFCLTIPMEKRWGNYIYDKWVIDKYPNASKHAHNGRIIGKNKGKNFKLFGKNVTIYDLLPRTIKFLSIKLGIRKNSMETKNHMNPFDYWYSTNYDLKNYMDDYYSDIINKVECQVLKKDLKNMYTNGNTTDKIQVLTFLSLIKNYFISEDWLDE